MRKISLLLSIASEYDVSLSKVDKPHSIDHHRHLCVCLEAKERMKKNSRRLMIVLFASLSR